MFLAAALFFVLTSFTTNSNFHKLVAKRTDIHIGYFSSHGHEYDAFGDGAGNVTAVYYSDINDNDFGLVTSWSGTYVLNNINVTIHVNTVPNVITFVGACYDE